MLGASRRTDAPDSCPARPMPCVIPALHGGTVILYGRESLVFAVRTMISAEEFKKHFLGYNILGCTVRSKDAFCFVAQEDYTQWPDWDGEEPEIGRASCRERV